MSEDKTNQAEVKQAQAEVKQDGADKPVEQPVEHTNNPASPDAIAAQHEAVDAAMAQRNEENAEGHAKNMEMVEAAAIEANMRTEYADDPRAKHTPTGKENNLNTPRVLPDGSKVWGH